MGGFPSKHTHVCVHMHTCTCMHTPTHAHTHMCVPVCTCTHLCTYTRDAHTYAHARTRIHACTHSQICTCTHMHTHLCTCAHAHAHTQQQQKMAERGLRNEEGILHCPITGVGVRPLLCSPPWKDSSDPGRGSPWVNSAAGQAVREPETLPGAPGMQTPRSAEGKLWPRSGHTARPRGPALTLAQVGCALQPPGSRAHLSISSEGGWSPGSLASRAGCVLPVVSRTGRQQLP